MIDVPLEDFSNDVYTVTGYRTLTVLITLHANVP